MHWGLAPADETLRWAAVEVLARLSAFRPGGGGGTAYVRAVRREPTGRLMGLVDDARRLCPCAK